MKALWVLLGVAVMWIASASPGSHLDHHLLTAHMVAHLLIMLVAAPLILRGAYPIAIPWRPHPVFCWLAGTITVVAWHVPRIFEIALRSHGWHAVEQVTFFMAGILFWWPVVHGENRTVRWSIPVYLLLATLPCDVLAAFLALCGQVVYRPYLLGGGRFGLSPLEDQALAGALMWVSVTFAYLVPALVVTAKLLYAEGDATVPTGAD